MLKTPNYKKFRKQASARNWMIALALAILVLVGGVWALRTWYNRNLQPVSSSLKMSYFTVSPGDTRSQIAKNLEKAGLIRSAKAFENYVRSNEIENLQAGTYVLSPSMDVPEIVRKISTGDVAKNLLTILPAKRLDQIKNAFIRAGYSAEQVEAAFNPELYADMSVLSSLPAGASLEGYLYPDSFQKQSDTPADTIVRQSLEEMQKYITPDVISGLAAQGLSVYQGIILASIVEQETSNPIDQPAVAQVFISRLKQGMALGSDVTATYGAVKDNIALPDDPAKAAVVAISHDSPYNTRMHAGLPPGPIGNFTASALRAVAQPSSTDYLFFVAGDDGVLHFSRTVAEHDAAAAQYCHKACGR